MADLGNLTSTYCPDEAFDIELRGPDGAQLFNDDGTAMTIGVLGADSDIAVKARNQTSNRRIQQGARLKLTAEGIDSDAVAYLAKLSTRWNITLGGEKPVFNTEAAMSLYMNPKLAFVREQVDAGIAERSNFLKG